MKFRSAALLTVGFAFAASTAAWAQIAPIPKPSERRVGELEGWSDSAKPAAKAGKAEPKKSAAAKTGKAAKVEKSTPEKSQDGGIPLPSSRQNPDDYAPVGFDKDGKLGTGMKF